MNDKHGRGDRRRVSDALECPLQRLDAAVNVAAHNGHWGKIMANRHIKKQTHKPTLSAVFPRNQRSRIVDNLVHMMARFVKANKHKHLTVERYCATDDAAWAAGTMTKGKSGERRGGTSLTSSCDE
jgi:hypothetical protein